MAVLHLAILKSIQNSNGKIPVLIAVIQRREVRYIKTDYVVDEFYQFDNGLIACRKDAKTMNQRLKYVISGYHGEA